MEQVSDTALTRTALEQDAGASMMMRVRVGDVGAFAALVERYQRTVLNTVYKYVGNRASAEELAQDVFVRVYRARGSYEPKAKFETWLYRIVFNVCANAADYGSRRRALSLDQATSGDARPRGELLGDPTAPDPLQRVEQGEIAEIVRRAIAKLPAQQRAALILSRYEEMPHREIAATLDTTVDAVKSLLFRARENLRQTLAPYFPEEPRDEM